MARSRRLRRQLRLPGSADDSSMGVAFAAHISGRYLYVKAWNRWLRWTGKQWRTDTTEKVFDEARAWVADVIKLLVEAGWKSEEIKHYLHCRSRGRLD